MSLNLQTNAVLESSDNSEDLRKRLWDSLNRKHSVDVDTGRLQRLLTFVEVPAFKKSAESWNQPEQLLEREKTKRLMLQTNFGSIGLGGTSTLPDIGPPRKTRQQTMFISTGGDHPQAKAVTGLPVEPDVAFALRKIVYGSSLVSFSTEWRRNFFVFQDIRGPHAYGLCANKDGARGLILCVQAYIIKNLLYASHISDQYRQSYMQPSEGQRREALIRSMADILWLVGGHRRACVCVPGSDDGCVEEQLCNYRPDGITERMLVYEVQSFDEIRSFLRKHLTYFESPIYSGCVYFLYSIALSRGLNRLQEDMGGDEKQRLLDDQEELTTACLNLVITGSAVPHLHNGVMFYDPAGNYLSRPIAGIQTRAEIGYLQWDRASLDTAPSFIQNEFDPPDRRPVRRASDTCLLHPAAGIGGPGQDEQPQNGEVGTMLKTPRIPVWLTRVNGQIGMLFSTNADLVNYWRTERRFTLYYYTGIPSHGQTCRLSVDTRRHRTAKMIRSRLVDREERKRIPALELCIQTKWYGAHVDWNGTLPFV